MMKPPHLAMLVLGMVLPALSSCVFSVSARDVSTIATVETMLYPKQPFYYQGRKNGCDYFQFTDDGVRRRLKCRAGTYSRIKPFPYSNDSSVWLTLNGNMGHFGSQWSKPGGI